MSNLQSEKELIKQAYRAFNKRNIEAVLTLMHPNVHWPNGWEGGYINGHAEVREYWKRQWKEINPVVKPVSFTERKDGRIEVLVQQIVKDLEGKELFNGFVKHVYTFKNELVIKMNI